MQQKNKAMAFERECLKIPIYPRVACLAQSVVTCVLNAPRLRGQIRCGWSYVCVRDPTK